MALPDRVPQGTIRVVRRTFNNILGLSLLLFAMVAEIGCRKSSSSDAVASNTSDSLRLVSLSPAITRTVKDFGLETSIVGRTPWCESIDASIPVVGDLMNLDYETLIKLNPTHVLLQPQSSGFDERLTLLAGERGWVLGVWNLDTIDDIDRMVLELPGILYAEDEAKFALATSRAATIVNDLASALSPGIEAIFQGETLIITDVDPVLAFGRGSFLHDILLAIGGHNATDGQGYPVLSLEDVVRLDPEAIVIVKSGEVGGADGMNRLGVLADTEIRAVVSGRVAILGHPDALLPSTGLIGVANELKRILVSFATSEP